MFCPPRFTSTYGPHRRVQAIGERHGPNNQISFDINFEIERGAEIYVLLGRQDGTKMIEMCHRHLSSQQSPAFSDQFGLKEFGSNLPGTFDAESIRHVF